MSSLTFQRDPNKPQRVVILLDGKYMCSMDWQVADQCADALRSVARKAEEYAKANHIIDQSALLIRSGAPFALSSDPKIQDAAYTQAQWDTKARKAMPLAGVPTPRSFGTPNIVKS